MARTHGQILVTIWGDPEFTARSSAAQRVYMMLTSQLKLSMVGVLDYKPHRWAQYAPDTTVEDIENAVQELADHRFVVVDRDTDELLVRTIVRYDGIRHTANRNLLKGMWSAWESVESPVLRRVVVEHIPAAVWDSKRSAAPPEAVAMRPSCPQPEPPDRTGGYDRRSEPKAQRNGATVPDTQTRRSESQEPAVSTAGSDRRSEPRGRARSNFHLPPSNSHLPSQSTYTATGGPGSGEDDDRVAAAAKILGTRDYEQALADGIEIRSAAHGSYKARCIEAWLPGGRRHDELADAAALLPRLDGQALADHVDPNTNPFLTASAPGSPPAAIQPRSCERCADTPGWVEVDGGKSPNGQPVVTVIECTHEPVSRPALRAVPDLPASAPPCPQEPPADPATGASTPQTGTAPYSGSGVS